MKILKPKRAPFEIARLKIIIGSFLFLVINDAHSSPESREALIKTTLDQFHGGEYDSALANCKTLKEADPNDLAGYVLEVGVYQGIMRYYRVRHFEPVFDSLLTETIKLGKKNVRRNSPAEQQFLYGSALGYQALHRFAQGEWSAALKDALQAKSTVENALRFDKKFADPWLMLGIYEHGKSKILSMGIGLFSGKKDAAIKMLERAQKDGLYTSTDAALALLGVYRDTKNYRKGLAICEELNQKYPGHASVLYNRAVFLQHLKRFNEAEENWRMLIEKLESFQYVSNAFLAECRLNIARIHAEMAKTNGVRNHGDQIRTELTLALAASEKFDPERELAGTREKADEVKTATEKMLRKYQ